MTTIVVTQAVAANLRELSRRLADGKGAAKRKDLDKMFTTKLSASGNLPATHFISSGLIDPRYLNAMTSPVRLRTVAKKAWEDDGNVFPFTQTQVTNALAACTVSDGTRIADGSNPEIPAGTVLSEGPHELIARLGLKIVQEAI